MSQPVLFSCVCGTTYALPEGRPLGAVECPGCDRTPLAPANFESPEAWRRRWEHLDLVPTAVLRPLILL